MQEVWIVHTQFARCAGGARGARRDAFLASRDVLATDRSEENVVWQRQRLVR
jgi:hypothetical protein